MARSSPGEEFRSRNFPGGEKDLFVGGRGEGQGGTTVVPASNDKLGREKHRASDKSGLLHS